ncbi:hypothetical protein SEVIR_7G091850v4 [Setaria viridis]
MPRLNCSWPHCLTSGSQGCGDEDDRRGDVKGNRQDDDEDLWERHGDGEDDRRDGGEDLEEQHGGGEDVRHGDGESVPDSQRRRRGERRGREGKWPNGDVLVQGWPVGPSWAASLDGPNCRTYTFGVNITVSGLFASLLRPWTGHLKELGLVSCPTLEMQNYCCSTLAHCSVLFVFMNYCPNID